MGRLPLTGMPVDVLALVLAACTVSTLHRAAATNKLMHETGTDRRRKIAVLKQSPFHMTCHDVKSFYVYGHPLDENMMIKLSVALASGALAQLQVSSRLTALIPCIETWHTRSADLTVSFDVPYMP